MKTWFPLLLLCGLFPVAASGQVLTVQFGAPAIRWETRPPLVVIAPGYWVVEDSPDEVFYYDRWYWTRQDGRWFRSRDHRGHWGEVGQNRVPERFQREAPGHYRHYRSEPKRAKHPSAQYKKHGKGPKKGPAKNAGKHGKGGKGGKGRGRH